LSLDKEHGAIGVVVSWIAGWIAITILMRIIGQRVYRLDNHWRLWTISVMPWLALSMVGRQRLEKILGLDYIVQLSLATIIVITLAIFVFFEYRRLRSESAPNVELAQCEVCVTE
jgi:hypothetical protein